MLRTSSTAASVRLFKPVKVVTPTYSSLTVYQDITPLSVNQELNDNKRFTARRKNNCVPNACFTDTWFLLPRLGEFRAQVEKVAADLFHYFLGYGTEIDIVKEGDAYFVASRAVKDYVNWNDVLGYITVDDNGSLRFKRDGEDKPIIGLAKMAAITEFFADTDCYGLNFGLQAQGEGYRIFKIDNEHMFSFEHQARKVGAVSIEDTINKTDRFKSYLSSPQYLAEKNQMLKQIAETDFTIIEGILRTQLSADEREDARSLLTMMIHSIEVNPPICDDEDEVSGMSLATLKEQLLKIDQVNPADCGVEKIINELRELHQQLGAEIRSRIRIL